MKTRAEMIQVIQRAFKGDSQHMSTVTQMARVLDAIRPLIRAEALRDAARISLPPTQWQLERMADKAEKGGKARIDALEREQVAHIEIIHENAEARVDAAEKYWRAKCEDDIAQERDAAHHAGYKQAVSDMALAVDTARREGWEAGVTDMATAMEEADEGLICAIHDALIAQGPPK